MNRMEAVSVFSLPTRKCVTRVASFRRNKCFRCVVFSGGIYGRSEGSAGWRTEAIWKTSCRSVRSLNPSTLNVKLRYSTRARKFARILVYADYMLLIIE